MLIKIARITAAGSFIIGTLLFITYILSNASILLLIGFYYVMIAFILNLIILLILLTTALSDRDNYIEYFKAIGLMLLNIPASFLYLVVLQLF